MDITVATLIYKSPDYLDFVMESLIESCGESKHNVQFLIVCNDATEEVINRANEWKTKSPWKHYITVINHKNPDPNSYWIQRVYAAWNRCLQECKTEAICFVNSDMRFTNGWLDNLAKHDINKCVPTSRLVESARMPSLPGLISKNFGQTMAAFKANEHIFKKFAAAISENKITPKIGAFMPCLVKVDILKSIGGWHQNAWNQFGHEIPGDKITFNLLENKLGIRNIMCHDSIVYHLQRGESAETNDLK